jgi:hypothetical protein
MRSLSAAAARAELQRLYVDGSAYRGFVAGLGPFWEPAPGSQVRRRPALPTGASVGARRPARRVLPGLLMTISLGLLTLVVVNLFYEARLRAPLARARGPKLHARHEVTNKAFGATSTAEPVLRRRDLGQRPKQQRVLRTPRP